MQYGEAVRMPKLFPAVLILVILQLRAERLGEAAYTAQQAAGAGRARRVAQARQLGGTVTNLSFLIANARFTLCQ